MSNDLLAKIDFAKLLMQIGFTDIDPKAKEYLGFCVFHEDVNTRSFSANLEKKLFNCFGCGIRGNAIGLYAKWKHVDYQVAKVDLEEQPDFRSLDMLAVKMSTENPVPVWKRLQMLTEYCLALPTITSSDSLEHKYLNSRGLSDKTLDDFGVRRYASASGEDPSFSEDVFYFFVDKEHSLSSGPESRRYSPTDLSVVGIEDILEPERFRDRFSTHPVVFPFWYAGKVTYIQGRWPSDVLPEGQLKYLSSKGGITHLYNHAILPEVVDTVYICEGAMDALSMYELGFKSVVATPGVKIVKADWLTDFRCKTVELAFDNDRAGNEGISLWSELLSKKGIEVKRFVIPPEHKDVNKWLQAQKASV